MKRIGIITYHQANNFGAVLQCYALQEILKRLNFSVKVIDYRQPFTELIYNPIRWDIMKKGLTNPRLLAGYLFKVFPILYKRAQAYNSFRSRFLQCSRPVKSGREMPQCFDVYLIGSDQMWSLHPTNNIIEPVYFGEFTVPKGSSIQGYAISSNIESLHTIGKKYLTNSVKRFERLSFREETVRDEVCRMTGIHGEVVVDPTLLLNAEDWNHLITHNLIGEPYLLTYFLSNDTDNEAFRIKVSAFAKQNKLKVVDVFDIAYSPIAFLSAIKYASVVFAASFHATAFSIIMKKKFYAFRSSDGRDIRYINLLHNLGLDNRIVSTVNISSLPLDDIDYADADLSLDALRQHSIQYLKTL